MPRIAGQILIVADGDPSLSLLESALLESGVNVIRSEAEFAARALEQSDPDVLVIENGKLGGRLAQAVTSSVSTPAIVAIVADESADSLRAAMRVGAREFIARPLEQDLAAHVAMLRDLTERWRGSGGRRRVREAESLHRLKQQVHELTDRYVRQCRTFDEAQDVFYLDLSRMMTIFDNIMDGIVFTDPEGQVTLMNPNAEELLGVKTIFAIGKAVRDLGHGVELIQEISNDHERALIDGGVSERTIEVHHAGRDLSYLKLRTTAVVDYKGSFAGILTVIKDVTSEFKSEQMKNQYLSIVSHELRTPLTGIKTFSTMMAKGTLGKLPGAQQNVMDSIREQSLRLEHEVDKLISLGRIESGDFALDRKAFPLVDLLATVTAPFKQVARDRSIAFHVARPAESPWVLADREDLRRAIQALIENALKFTPRGGCVEIFLEDCDDFVRVHVKDNGPGINPRYHGRIFDKFFQVEDPLTRQHGGAGLGLNVARGVARAHGGRIEVVSDLGHGSDFCICLPTTDRESAQNVDIDQGDATSVRKET